MCDDAGCGSDVSMDTSADTSTDTSADTSCDTSTDAAPEIESDVGTSEVAPEPSDSGDAGLESDNALSESNEITGDTGASEIPEAESGMECDDLAEPISEEADDHSEVADESDNALSENSEIDSGTESSEVADTENEIESDGLAEATTDDTEPNAGASEALMSDEGAEATTGENAEEQPEQGDNVPTGYTPEQWSAEKGIRDYLANHDYGMGDYDTYSKDPEWQQLNNDRLIANGQAPVDYSADNKAQTEQGDKTAPPGYTTEQWNAFQDINRYHSDHNYGMGDYETYSQDPEWQRLNDAYRTANGQAPLDYSTGNELQPEPRAVYNEVVNPTNELNNNYENQSEFDARDLSTQERKAFENYASDIFSNPVNYQTMNNILRGKDTGYMTDYQREQSNIDIGLMRDALDRKELAQDTQLYRGLSDPRHIFGADYAQKTPQELIDSVKGKEFCEEGFLSTSTSKDAASQFAHSFDGAVMSINAPKGANGMCMGELNGFKGEKEFLMPPGTTYTINDARKDQYGNWQFDTTITGRRK